MNKNHIFVSAAVALIVSLVVVWLVGGDNQSAPSTLGGTTNYDALSLSSSLTVSGDGVVSGGTLNITTSNTATSTVVAGCYEFYATSTATAQKFQASTTPGAMYSQYGACPRL